MNCAKCGKQIPDGNRFCTKCGSKVFDAGSEPPTVITPFGSGPVPESGEANISPGRTLDGRYRLDALLGSGGMGAVYRAARVNIGDEVAIKVLHSEFVRDPGAVERFRREAQAAARLKHPNVVTIHDFGITGDGMAFLVMEMVEGQSLRDIIKEQGTLPQSTVAGIISQVCAALDEAHNHNIVHRDLKPDNIIVANSPSGLRVKVLDFGVAKLKDLAVGKDSLTKTGMVVGTPHYMSPEQCMAEELDGRSDIYSLGVMLYEMLSGRVPFDAPSFSAIVMKHVTNFPPPLSEIVSEISPAAEAVVMQALEKQRESRPQTAGELARNFTAAVEATARPTSPARGGTDARLPVETSVETAPGARRNAIGPTPPIAGAAATAAGSRPLSCVESPAPKSGGKFAPLFAGVFLGLVIAVGAVWWLMPSTPTGAPDTHNSSPASNNAGSSIGSNAANSSTASNTANPSSGSKPNSDRAKDDKPAQQGKWFVILGSFQKTERRNAERQLRLIQRMGHDVKIVDSDNYPNLKDGLWVVLMGPYNESYANDLVKKLRPVVPGAYAKSGW